MLKSLIGLSVLVGLVLTGCPKRNDMPESAYDPEIVATAQALAEDSQQADETPPQTSDDATSEGECNWQTGGCQVGWICWDSWFCKGGFDDQCSASGDKRCHKECIEDIDCPRSEPKCKKIPIFRGSDRGKVEKLCISKD